MLVVDYFHKSVLKTKISCNLSTVGTQFIVPTVYYAELKICFHIVSNSSTYTKTFFKQKNLDSTTWQYGRGNVYICFLFIMF